MNVSNRTPEGLPGRCPICGGDVRVESSLPAGDAPCPTCGELLWWCREHLANLLGVPGEAISAETTLHDLGADSLDVVELVMELEQEFDIQIADEDALKHMQTVGDAIRYIEVQLRDRQHAAGR